MLTSLDFLNQGKRWPPTSEKERLKNYADNRALFLNQHQDIYQEQFTRIRRVIGNFDQIISYPMILNYFKLISVKTADLLCGEAPVITAESEAEMNAVKKINENSFLNSVMYQVVVDASRYGTGLFYVYKKNGKGVVDLTQPSFWFPVVNPQNVRDVRYHVIASPYKTEEKLTYNNRLSVEIHEKGYIEKRTLALNDGVIAGLIDEPSRVPTGLSDFAIVPVANAPTSDMPFGYDDYSDVDSIICEIEVRSAQIAKILDKHSEPSMTGPSTALEEVLDREGNPTGEFKLRLGNYFVNDPDENGKSNDIKYITWDAQLEYNFRQIEMLTNQLYTISEMGAALFGDLSQSSGVLTSGAALKRLMMSPLAKVNRLKSQLDPALKKAVKLASEVGGYKKITSVNVDWNDGLPDDEKETAETISLLSSAKAVSVEEMVRRVNKNLSEEAVQNEVNRIYLENGILVDNPDDLTL